MATMDAAVDPEYEFNAPQFCDFTNDPLNMSGAMADEDWFAAVRSPNQQGYERPLTRSSAKKRTPMGEIQRSSAPSTPLSARKTPRSLAATPTSALKKGAARTPSANHRKTPKSALRRPGSVRRTPRSVRIDENENLERQITPVRSLDLDAAMEEAAAEQEKPLDSTPQPNVQEEATKTENAVAAETQATSPPVTRSRAAPTPRKMQNLVERGMKRHHRATGKTPAKPTTKRRRRIAAAEEEQFLAANEGTRDGEEAESAPIATDVPVPKTPLTRSRTCAVTPSTAVSTVSSRRVTRSAKKSVSRPLKLTEPISPHLSTSNRQPRAAAQSSEELSAAENVSRRQALVKKLQESRKRANAIIKGKSRGISVQKSTRPLTQPISPDLHTRKVSRRTGDSQQSEGAKGDFESLAAAVKKFHTKTPTRYRTRPRSQSQSGAEEPKEKWVPKLTVPLDFTLATSRRSKSTSQYKSREEEELETIQCAPKFRARPVSRRVLDSAGDMGLPKVAKRPLTRPISPHLSSSRFSRRTMSSASEASSARPFRARKINEGIATSAPRPVAKPRPLTVPRTPQLKGKRRPYSAQSVGAREEDIQAMKEGRYVFKARKMPNFHKMKTRSKTRKLRKRTLTEPLAMQLRSVQRHEEHLAAMASKRATEDDEERARKRFRARKMPDFNAPSFAPAPSTRELTRPTTQTLQSVKRHEEAKRRFEESLAAELEAERERFSSFRARRPAQGRAPESAPAPAPLTEPKTPTLRTRSREPQRRAFDEQVAQQQTEKAAQAEQEAAAKEALADAQEAEERRQHMFHARPVPYARTFEVRASTRALTEPISPQLSYKQRVQ